MNLDVQVLDLPNLNEKLDTHQKYSFHDNGTCLKTANCCSMPFKMRTQFLPASHMLGDQNWTKY